MTCFQAAENHVDAALALLDRKKKEKVKEENNENNENEVNEEKIKKKKKKVKNKKLDDRVEEVRSYQRTGTYDDNTHLATSH